MSALLKSVVAGAFILPLAFAYPAGAPSVSQSSSTAASTLIPNTYPDLSPAQLQQVAQLAHGTEPNGAAPPSISDQGAVNLQLIEYNENFEVAFFASFINNITSHVAGFDFGDDQNFVISALTAHLNQEIEHAFNARSALKAFGKTVIDPCKYKFPTTTGKDATILAKTFTDVVLGTLQDVSVIFAENGDTALPGLVASVIGQEGEQNGFYRLLQNDNLVPAALPFLTRSTRDFAFSALQGFIDGQCAGTETLIKDGLKIFGVLNLLTPNVQPKDQNLQFSFDIASLKQSANLDFQALFSDASSSSQWQDWSKGSNNGLSNFNWSNSSLFLTYINQQNLPISVPLLNPSVSGTVVTFEASFPFQANLLNSLTIAAVTVGNKFTDARDVAKHTVFAPALIEVN